MTFDIPISTIKTDVSISKIDFWLYDTNEWHKNEIKIKEICTMGGQTICNVT